MPPRRVRNKNGLNRLTASLTGKPPPKKNDVPKDDGSNEIVSALREVIVAKNQDRESLERVLKAIADKPIPVPHVTVTQEAALPHSWLFKFKKNAQGQTTHVLAAPQRKSDETKR